jgi:hypothetical protein
LVIFKMGILDTFTNPDHGKAKLPDKGKGLAEDIACTEPIGDGTWVACTRQELQTDPLKLWYWYSTEKRKEFAKCQDGASPSIINEFSGPTQKEWDAGWWHCPKPQNKELIMNDGPNPGIAGGLPKVRQLCHDAGIQAFKDVFGIDPTSDAYYSGIITRIDSTCNERFQTNDAIEEDINTAQNFWNSIFTPELKDKIKTWQQGQYAGAPGEESKANTMWWNSLMMDADSPLRDNDVAIMIDPEKGPKYKSEFLGGILGTPFSTSEFSYYADRIPTESAQNLIVMQKTDSGKYVPVVDENGKPVTTSKKLDIVPTRVAADKTEEEVTNFWNKVEFDLNLSPEDIEYIFIGAIPVGFISYHMGAPRFIVIYAAVTLLGKVVTAEIRTKVCELAKAVDDLNPAIPVAIIASSITIGTMALEYLVLGSLGIQIMGYTFLIGGAITASATLFTWGLSEIPYIGLKGNDFGSKLYDMIEYVLTLGNPRSTCS